MLQTERLLGPAWCWNICFSTTREWIDVNVWSVKQNAETMTKGQNHDRWRMHHESQNVFFAYTAEPDHLHIHKNKPSTWCSSLPTNQLQQFCPSSFSMESCTLVPTLISLLPRLSGLVWPGPPPFPASSILPRASGHDHRERLSSFLSQPTHCLPSAPLSVAAWVTLSFRSCLYTVTGKSFLWCSKLWWIDHTVSDLD